MQEIHHFTPCPTDFMIFHWSKIALKLYTFSKYLTSKFFKKVPKFHHIVSFRINLPAALLTWVRSSTPSCIGPKARGLQLSFFDMEPVCRTAQLTWSQLLFELLGILSSSHSSWLEVSWAVLHTGVPATTTEVLCGFAEWQPLKFHGFLRIFLCLVIHEFANFSAILTSVRWAKMCVKA